MWSLKSVLSTVVVAAAMTASAPALAGNTTIATFEPLGAGTNIRWINNNSTGTGTGGRIISTRTGTTNALADRQVSFSFLRPGLTQLANITARFNLDATAPDGNPVTSGGSLVQSGISGTFSFTSTAKYTIGSATYDRGANLLTGTFTNASIFGTRGGTTAAFAGSNLTGSKLSYTSAFGAVSNATANDFILTFSGVTPSLEALPLGSSTPTSALRNFRASAGGSFSVDAVPEPASWAMMIVGFGLIGSAIRRRRAAPTVVYA